MKRELRITEDGSHTLYVPELDEPYHSIYGALQESKHVFIDQGLSVVKKKNIRILEIGFGTGLNAILTMSKVNTTGQAIHYHAVEKYPLDREEFGSINFEQLIEGIPRGILAELHNAPWGKDFRLSGQFILHKELADFRSMDPPGNIDLVYFDAFDPQKQPHLWTPGVFGKISELMNPGSLLVTYSAKGSVRRALASSDFHVEKVPGPPGKREMIKATRI